MLEIELSKIEANLRMDPYDEKALVEFIQTMDRADLQLDLPILYEIARRVPHIREVASYLLPRMGLELAEKKLRGDHWTRGVAGKCNSHFFDKESGMPLNVVLNPIFDGKKN